MASTSPEEEKPSATKEGGKTAATGVELFPVKVSGAQVPDRNADPAVNLQIYSCP
jgi:hypothetical protein